MPDAVRQLIADRCRELGISDARLSRAIGHADSYINQYRRRGSPKTLPDRERRAVAKALQLDEASPQTDGVAQPEAAVIARQVVLARSPRHIPAFHEGRAIDFDHITERVERPDVVAISENSFALWIHHDHGRLAAGDLAYVTGGRPPRAQDVVVALTLDQRHIVAIGTMTDITAERVTVATAGSQRQQLPRAAHVILKVAAVRFA